MLQFSKCTKILMLVAALNYICELQQGHITAIQCPVASSFLEWRGDIVSPSNCSLVTGVFNRTWCSLQCHDNLLCVAFRFTCAAQCVCQICRDTTSTELDANSVFFLRRRTIVYNIPPPVNFLVHVWLSGGLYPGHVLQVLFSVDQAAYSSQFLAMMLSTGSEHQQEPDTYALIYTMNMASGGTERMSNLQGQEDRETDEPYFHFVSSSSFNVVIVTDKQEFQIYIDGNIYCTFRHRVRELDTIQHLNYQPYTQPLIKMLNF